MTQSAELNFRRRADLADDVRSARRMNFLPTLMIAVILGMVTIALLAQARLVPEQRLELFRSYDFPALP
jgi:hypothetical protein